MFTRLTQAAYNKDKPTAQRRNLSYRHLANHIKSDIGKKESFPFRNFSIQKDFTRDNGLRRDVSVCIYTLFLFPITVFQTRKSICLWRGLHLDKEGQQKWTLAHKTTCGNMRSVCKAGNRSSWNYFRGLKRTQSN